MFYSLPFFNLYFRRGGRPRFPMQHRRAIAKRKPIVTNTGESTRMLIQPICCIHVRSYYRSASSISFAWTGAHGGADPHPHHQDYPQHHRRHVSKRKHFWSLEELQNETDQLLAYCLGANTCDTTCTSGTWNKDLHYVSNSAHIFHLIEAWMEQAKSGRGIEAARAARNILQNVINPPVLLQGATTNSKEQYYQRYQFLPSVITTNFCDVVLQAFAVCDGGLPAAEEAETLLKDMIRYCQQPKQKEPEQRQHLFRLAPTLKSFNIVLTCWARSEAPDAGGRAHQLTNETMMREWNHWCVAHVPSDGLRYEIYMDERSLVSLMDAWTHSRHPQAPERALELLHQAMNAPNSNSNNNSQNSPMFRNVRLDVAVFNACIYAWVQSGRGRAAARQAEDILRQLLQWSQTNNHASTVQPTTRTYSMIIDAWAHCSDSDNGGEEAAQRGEDILSLMFEQYQLGQTSKNAAAAAAASGAVKPNAIVVTTAIAAWSRAAPHSQQAPERAERLWQSLYKLYQESGFRDSDLAPGVELGNAVLAAWARSYRTRQDSVEGALAALKRLRELQLVDLTSYNTVLDALSRKGRGREARQLLEWLEGQQGQEQGSSTLSTLAPPNRISYNSVLSAIARSSVVDDRIGEEAEELLRTMEQLSSSDPRRTDLKPDKLSYTNVINAWARSDHLEKASRGHVLLREMVDRYRAGDVTLRPDPLVFAVLLKSCARTTKRNLRDGGQSKAEDRKVLRLALQTLETLEEGEFGPPNDVVYATALHAINRLTGTLQQREELLGSVFQRCAARGLVSNSVMAEMNQGGSLRLFLRLTDGKNQLDPKWSEKVPPKHRPKS